MLTPAGPTRLDYLLSSLIFLTAGAAILLGAYDAATILLGAWIIAFGLLRRR